MNSVQPVIQLSSLLQEHRFKPLNDTKPGKIILCFRNGIQPVTELENMLQRDRNKLLKIQCPAKHSFFT